MYVLGLHFGHDASVSIIKNGKILVCLERERRTRLRHAIGLTIDDIYESMKTAGCSLSDMDFCAVTSTQNIEYIFSEPEKLKFEFARDYQPLESNTMSSGISMTDINKKQFKRVLSLVRDGADHPYIRRLTEDLKSANEQFSIGEVEDYYSNDLWDKRSTLEQIGNLIIDNPVSSDMSQAMQIPIKLIIDDKKIPGWMMSHHFAHAAYAFYTSNYKKAAIITQDGSLPRGGYWNGMCYYGTNEKLFPIMPHYLNTGKLYEGVSILIGFDMEAGPGKMMGLSSYGKPTFFDKKFVGNTEDFDLIIDNDPQVPFPGWTPHPFDNYLNKWVNHCAMRAEELGYDITPLGNTDRILEPINVDIAASTQLLLEEIFLATTNVVYKSFKENYLDHQDNLCLSGGTALNCPSNTRLYNEGPFDDVFIPPAVHDGGLSTGAALGIYHNTLGKPRTNYYGNTAKLSYLGLKYDEINSSDIFEQYSNQIKYSYHEDIAKVAAERLAKNQVLAIFTGRSEVGPRALGHRSILAHPGYEENWKKVNDIKRREYWRPFAPAVLESKSKEWFKGTPDKSPFMLYIAEVLKSTIPAITHVDKSSRIQTVNEDSILLFKILTEFDILTGIPVLMNTSFNGPGEPIIEKAQQAINFFIKSSLDAVIIENYEITKV